MKQSGSTNELVRIRIETFNNPPLEGEIKTQK
jgi:hypothetical protein